MTCQFQVVKPWLMNMNCQRIKRKRRSRKKCTLTIIQQIASFVATPVGCPDELTNETPKVTCIFCLDREYSHLVIERSDSPNKDLFDIEALHALCNFTDQMISTPSYAMVCDTETYSKKCCRPWSISSYILLLSNKTNCAEIQVS